ncbi:hypothetical protein AK88_01181 [Plasmodium fragile]|uniref:histone acetyltransferase n=1 Tax=Plasmodium fragile TaxID=5857 RepID=A0A0D9QPT5_PLAFR|nr:uncharacterized protein AK88_01181 [Plasmodium fragile]KJP89095.1 hypothetical protein AK88_01181 [Plasmodium fragile]
MKAKCSNRPSIGSAEESKNEEMDREYYNCIKNCANDLQNLSLNFFPSINTYTCIPKINAINSITFHPCISSQDYFNNTYSFKPLFTHHFFSDSEQVIGFDSLKIDFYYTCDSYEVFMKISGSICDQYENSNYIMLMLLQSLYITTPYPGGFIETEEEFLKILRRNEQGRGEVKNEQGTGEGKQSDELLTQDKIYKPPGFIIYEKKLSDDIYLQIRKCGFSSDYFKLKNANDMDEEEDQQDDDDEDDEDDDDFEEDDHEEGEGQDGGGVYHNGFANIIQNGNTNFVKNEITPSKGQPCTPSKSDKNGKHKKGSQVKDTKSENKASTKGGEINNTPVNQHDKDHVKKGGFLNESCEADRNGVDRNGDDRNEGATPKHNINDSNCESSTMSIEFNKDNIKKGKEDHPPKSESDDAACDNDNSLVESKKAKKNLTKYVTERDMSKLYRHYLRVVRAKRRSSSVIAKGDMLKEKCSGRKELEKQNGSVGSAPGSVAVSASVHASVHAAGSWRQEGGSPSKPGAAADVDPVNESAAAVHSTSPRKGSLVKKEISPKQRTTPSKGASAKKSVESPLPPRMDQNPPHEAETNRRKKKKPAEQVLGEKYDYTVKKNFELLHRKVEWFYHWFIESASNIEYDYRWSVILPYIVFKHDEQENKFAQNKFIENLNVELLKNRTSNVNIRPSIKLESLSVPCVAVKKEEESSLPNGQDVEIGMKKNLKRGASDEASARKEQGEVVKKRKKGDGAEAEQHEVMVKKESEENKMKGGKKNVKDNIKEEGDKIQPNCKDEQMESMFDPSEYILTSEIVIKAIENTLKDVRSKEEEEYYAFHKNYEVVYLYSDLEKSGGEATKGVVENVQAVTDVKGEKKTKGRKEIPLKEGEIVKGVTNEPDRQNKKKTSKNENASANENMNKNANEKQSLYYFYLFGLATTYTFFTFQFDRNRISQFLIFPPMQSKGLGMKVLEKIYHLSIVNSNVKEITVEDPAVSFTQLRDIITIKMCIDLRILNPTILYPSDYLKEKNIEKEYVELDKKKFMKVCKETHKQITRMVETLMLAGVLPHPAPCYTDVGEDKSSSVRKKEKKNESPVALNSMEHFESSDLCKDVRIKIKKRIKNDYIGNLINKNMNCMASDVFQDYVKEELYKLWRKQCRVYYR